MSLVIRPFRESDKPEILEIAKHTWGGYDYLPNVLDEWARDANRHIFVAEFRGRVVSFSALRIIESGRTGWLEGLRVRRWYRRRGYARAMTRHLFDAGARLGVERLRLTTASVNVGTRRLVQQFGMDELLRMKVFWRGDLGSVQWSYDLVPTVPCTVKDVLLLLKVKPEIFPKGIIAYNWYAFDAVRTSIESLGGFGQFWMGKDNGNVRSLSFGYVLGDPGSKQWYSAVYALDGEAFLSALSVQLRAAKANGATTIMCLHPVRFRRGKKLSWLKTSSETMGFVLYEKRRPFV
ncbi:MAG: GNAT family N-acetyltransferase [Promethearchaeota archaeon]